MSVYLARIEHINDYFNIRPVMELIEGGFVEVDAGKFGQYGTITISAIYGQVSDSPFIQEQKYVMLTISDSELASLEQTYTGSKIKAVDYISKVKPVDSFGIREVIKLPKGFTSNTYSEWGNDTILDIMQPITNSVYLSDENSVFGPFSWKVTPDGGYKFSPNAIESDPYVISEYLISDFEEPIYTFDAAKRTTDLYYGRERHILKNDNLPEKSSYIDCIDDIGLKEFVGRLLSQNAETRKAKKEIRDAVVELPIEVMSEQRRNRILELAKNGDLADQTINLIPSVVLENKDSLEKIAQVILDNSNYMEKLYPVVKEQEEYNSIIEKIEVEKKTKQQELDVLKNEIQKLQDAGNEELTINSSEVQKLVSEKDELQRKLEAYKDFENLSDKVYKLNGEVEDTQNQYNMLLSMKNTLSTDIEQKVREAYSSFAFDGAISSLMLQEAANFEKSKNVKRTEALVATLQTVESYSDISNPVDLVNFVHKELTEKGKRNISKNDVANILICMAQGFLTVLAGEPGTGKTSLVSLIANILGLPNGEYNRYSEIAVEKGWTSRRDLIGYYNPLTKSFDASNKGLFSALSVLNEEKKNNIDDFPYVVLLDEANLSQMEHYWADFMSLCDFDKMNRRICLCEDYEYLISDTLRFMATINLDHTTEILSPRLIDRAWIIMLHSTDVDIEDFEVRSDIGKYPLIQYEAFKRIKNSEFWENQKLDTAITDKFNKIRVCFQDIGISFSPRIIGMIKKYCLSSKGVFDTSENVYCALDYAVLQKVLPIINGYGEDYHVFLEKLMVECDQNTMPKCYEMIQSIIKKGNLNMQYYQFFAR
ncbi:hypothetical protein acsn021_03880 [Anaerocolumna cellulosilytica]|uniref:Uncharacterized protein n=1 Tax=Anaerocolumna cellulosilytica TaxID=433286 RepID=A0A6S6QUR3_9FIRM|nr:AAA family ATPase [Anaerocolumna cellulosilytica]MBB5197377.1 hypothetical protein [Anaerocolumna cellulosilytica]BCJ92819.1 hypothetical protein acsn021_03880 [Anaerocolumna cellulosilytica]